MSGWLPGCFWQCGGGVGCWKRGFRTDSGTKACQHYCMHFAGRQREADKLLWQSYLLLLGPRFPHLYLNERVVLPSASMLCFCVFEGFPVLGESSILACSFCVSSVQSSALGQEGWVNNKKLVTNVSIFFPHSLLFRSLQERKQSSSSANVFA